MIMRTRSIVSVVTFILMLLPQQGETQPSWVRVGNGVRIDRFQFVNVFTKVRDLLLSPSSYRDFYAGIALIRSIQTRTVPDIEEKYWEILNRNQLTHVSGVVPQEVQQVLHPIIEVRPGLISIHPPGDLGERPIHAILLHMRESMAIESVWGTIFLRFFARDRSYAKIFIEAPWEVPVHRPQYVRRREREQEPKTKDRTKLLLVRRQGQTILIGEGDDTLSITVSNLTNSGIWLTISAPPLTKVRHASKSEFN